jgi:hypothetical protein
MKNYGKIFSVMKTVGIQDKHTVKNPSDLREKQETEIMILNWFVILESRQKNYTQ